MRNLTREEKRVWPRRRRFPREQTFHRHSCLTNSITFRSRARNNFSFNLYTPLYVTLPLYKYLNVVTNLNIFVLIKSGNFAEMKSISNVDGRVDGKETSPNRMLSTPRLDLPAFVISLCKILLTYLYVCFSRK